MLLLGEGDHRKFHSGILAIVLQVRKVGNESGLLQTAASNTGLFAFHRLLTDTGATLHCFRVDLEPNRHHEMFHI